MRISGGENEVEDGGARARVLAYLGTSGYYQSTRKERRGMLLHSSESRCRPCSEKKLAGEVESLGHGGCGT